MINSDLFNEFPKPIEAYIEAANNAHDVANWKPSHTVVMEAARLVGFQALRRRDTGAGQRGFAKHYKDVCKAYLRGERFKPVVIEKPKFAEKLNDHELQQRRMIGRNRVGQLRGMLRE